MTPVNFKGVTHVFTPPSGYNDKIYEIPVQVHPDGLHVTQWELTDKERETLAAGGRLEIWVVNQQPIMAIGAVPAP